MTLIVTVFLTLIPQSFSKADTFIPMLYDLKKYNILISLERGWWGNWVFGKYGSVPIPGFVFY